MSITKTIEEVLQMEVSCQPQYKVAKKLNVSQSYLNQLVTGHHRVSGMSIGIVEKMFPNATINLYGEGSSVQSLNIGQQNGGNIQQTASGSSATQGGAQDKTALRLLLTDAICDLGLEPGTQKTVIDTIRKALGYEVKQAVANP